MKKYYITHQDKETKEKNLALYKEIREKGEFIKGEWNFDYLVSTYHYNNKTYELWDDMELGVISEIVEFDN